MKKYSVPAIDKTMAIFKLFAESEQDYTVTEIHSQLDIPKGTVFMILSVLEGYGMVKKDTHGCYSLGPKIYELGMAYMTKIDIKQIAKPFMNRLAQETKFTAHLGIMSDNRILFVEKVELQSFIKFSTFPGMRSDIHNSSLGKAIAAFLPEEEVDRAIEAVGMGRYTPNTITEPELFKQVLSRIRINGYSIEDEEGEIGVRCVGAPIFDHEGKVIAAISITALKSDLPADLLPVIGEKIKETAVAISKELGYEIKKTD
ncbi:IclR family transcriptional regulator [Cohnella silvisoli]|uniref:IclR family transcriptional regulator n=1 Tax=Cohnella silvisoli TaxID=2873699 RepID=A0ABV1L3V1_9BACL|nr:IclR family transcriptional regulator [Cohnella silvisoli]MCD9026250.1 IclR family transcriptional regulator [Cohnella silvisoli]